MKAPNRPSRCVAVLLLVALTSCTSPGESDGDTASEGMAPWLDKVTREILQEGVTDPPSQILTFRYRQQTVFYRPPYCCDIPGVLYNAEGGVMCYPTGGYNGKGDGGCKDFQRTRSNCTAVWRDPRAKRSTDNPCAIERGNRPLR